jgi:hypothetical protein
MPTSFPTASPPGVLSVSPSSLAVDGTGAINAQTLLVQESGYSGNFSESDTCAGIATLAPGNGPGPSLSEAVTGVGPGQCSATFSDAFAQVQHATITVTTGGFSIQSRGLRR